MQRPTRRQLTFELKHILASFLLPPTRKGGGAQSLPGVTMPVQ